MDGNFYEHKFTASPGILILSIIGKLIKTISKNADWERNIYSSFLLVSKWLFYSCRIVPLHIKVLNVEIIIIGIIGGVAATYSAIRTMVGADTFIPPCYVNLTAASAFT